MKSAVKKTTRTLTTDNADTTDKERKSAYICEISGVMTDNKVYVDQNGIDIVQVNRADGLGIAELKKMGIRQIIISTEKNTVVTTRANKLGISCLQWIENKRTV